MKALLFVLVLGSSAVAQAQRCQPNTSCSQAYTRLQAYQDLLAKENSADDAKGNLQIVMDASQDTGIDLKTMTLSFNNILNMVGGNGQTTVARTLFTNLLRKSSEINYPIDRQASNIRTLIAKENALEDALLNYELIVKNLHREISLETGVENFNRIMTIIGGNGQTTEARRLYVSLAQYRDVETTPAIISALEAMIRIENSLVDAEGNLELVMKAARICGSLKYALEDFTETLRTVGGNGQTTAARDLFRTIYGL